MNTSALAFGFECWDAEIDDVTDTVEVKACVSDIEEFSLIFGLEGEVGAVVSALTINAALKSFSSFPSDCLGGEVGVGEIGVFEVTVITLASFGS